MVSESSENSRLERADALGLAFLRTIILLNAGAILAILTVIGNSNQDSQILFDLESVRCAMWAFLAGIISTLLGLVVSYSYTATAPEYLWSQFWNRYIIRFNFVLALVAIMGFFFGVASLIQGSTAAQ